MSKLASKLAELHKEVKGLRKDVMELKEMLMPEVTPSAKDRQAVARGRKQHERGEVEEWSEVKKRVARR